MTGLSLKIASGASAASNIGGCTWCCSFLARGTGGPIGARSPLEIVGGLVLPGITSGTHTIDGQRRGGAFLTGGAFGPIRARRPREWILCLVLG